MEPLEPPPPRSPTELIFFGMTLAHSLKYAHSTHTLYSKLMCGLHAFQYYKN